MMMQDMGDISGSREPSQSALSRPVGFDPGREVEVDMAARSVARDADFLAVAPKAFVRANLDLIEEARERLNDALARVA
jgi:hypothetical protein